MAIKVYEKDGKKLYEVFVKIRVHGTQLARRKKNIPSMALAKKIDAEFISKLNDLKDGPKRHTFDQWFEKCVTKMRLEYKPSTIIGYVTNYQKWISPIIGRKYLSEITPHEIHGLIYNNSLDGLPHARKDTLKRLKTIFQMAIDNGHISINPARGIKVKIPESKKLVLNRTEINTLLCEANKNNHPYYAHWILALLTGMRSGELYALKWSDVDFENGYISVNKSWNYKNGLGATKNYMNRVVPISSVLEKFLKTLLIGKQTSEDFVLQRLPSWTSGAQARELKNFCREIGITEIKFHDLRATFITQLLLKGVPVAKVMAIVGHSELKTTMLYLRLIGSDLKGATNELDITLPNNYSDNVISLFNR